MKKEIPIGDLRHRIVFEQPVEVDDGHGGHVVSWATFATVWAAVEPISGREYFEAHQMQREVTHRVKIRSLPGLDENMRIIFNDRVFEIESIIDLDERRYFMELLCRESK